MSDALRALLSDAIDTTAITTVEAWWERHRVLAARWPDSADLALVGGLHADRLGWAFSSGYQAAGSRLFSSGAPGPVALCATEAGGVHPRAIDTTLTRTTDGARLDGHKTFVTLGGFARALFVVAREGATPEGRPRLRVVRIDADAPGVEVRPLPLMPFVPEVPHAEILLTKVAVAEATILPGDGYTDYLKPFRTVEDLHVHAALVGFLLRAGRLHEWPDATLEALAGQASACRDLAAADPRSLALHVALAGTLAAVAAIAEDESLWARVHPAVVEAWQRDRPLLRVASAARDARLRAAWSALRRSPGA